MNQNTKNKYFQIHSNIKRCEDNSKSIAQKISELPDCDERHELLKQLSDEVSALTKITIEVISNMIKIRGCLKIYILKHPSIRGIGKIDPEHINRAKVKTLGYPKLYLLYSERRGLCVAKRL